MDAECSRALMTSASSNIDEYEGEMQVFVQQHLLSLLQPVNATQLDLQDQLNRLTGDTLARHVSIDESLDRVQRHEVCLQALSSDFSQTNQKVSRMHTELSQMIELTMKTMRERTEAVCSRMDAQLQDVAARTHSLEAWRLEADGDDDSGYIRQCLKEVGSMQERSIKLESQIIELQTSVEGLNHCNLGLSQRLESSKTKLDDACKDLHKVMSTTSLHMEETRRSLEAQKKVVAHMEERIVVVCMDTAVTKSKLSGTDSEVQKLWDTIGKVANEVNAEETNLGKMKSEMLELQKLDTRSAILELSKVCDSLDTRFTALAEGASPMVKNELSRLNKTADKTVRGLAENIASIRQVDEHTLQNSNDIRQILKTQGDHESNQEDRMKRVNTSLSDMEQKMAAVTETERIMQANMHDLSEVSARVANCEEAVENTEADLKTLFSGLASTNEQIARASNRLNLAHGGLSGMTKGISEAQKRVADGLHGVMPAEKFKFEEISLPGLPGTLPRRPATSMI